MLQRPRLCFIVVHVKPVYFNVFQAWPISDNSCARAPLLSGASRPCAAPRAFRNRARDYSQSRFHKRDREPGQETRGNPVSLINLAAYLYTPLSESPASCFSVLLFAQVLLLENLFREPVPPRAITPFSARGELP